MTRDVAGRSQRFDILWGKEEARFGYGTWQDAGGERMKRDAHLFQLELEAYGPSINRSRRLEEEV